MKSQMDLRNKERLIGHTTDAETVYREVHRSFPLPSIYMPLSLWQEPLIRSRSRRARNTVAAILRDLARRVRSSLKMEPSRSGQRSEGMRKALGTLGPENRRLSEEPRSLELFGLTVDVCALLSVNRALKPARA